MHYKEELDLFCRCIRANISIMLHKTIYEINIYIYIYAFSRRFYPKRLTLHSSYSFTFDQLLLSLGIEPMILALLAPCSTIWATGKPHSALLLKTHFKPPSSDCNKFLLRSHVHFGRLLLLKYAIYSLFIAVQISISDVHIHYYENIQISRKSHTNHILS